MGRNETERVCERLSNREREGKRETKKRERETKTRESERK